MLHLILVFSPLVGAIIAGFFGRMIGDRASQMVTVAFMAISALCAVIGFATYAGTPAFKVHVLDWIQLGSFQTEWALRVDTLSTVMMFVVSFISCLIHIYSVGYMAHDASVPRFMSYLSLFTFAMLMLVTSDNLLQLYFGWEGVGVASYLLIGFWYTKPSACAAAMKAFIVNRVGDFGLALGVAACYLVFDSIQYDAIFQAAPNFAHTTVHLFGGDFDTLTVICLLLFVGAMGKSAQLGLHTWLPDAMEGPTPVSALIHAATMVTAGVFLVARFSPVFEQAPTALAFVTFIGATTALFAASVGLVQNDIKRVIAYSTCSQLGYMFFACGVSAYQAGVFHLYTHAFFKALLFLSAGSVIHALHDEQDLRKMGGIWRKVPVTYAVMWIGSLALAGIPPFAGYWSKDAILEAAYLSHSTFSGYAFFIGILVAFMTAFYSFRLLFMAFHGKPRMDHHTFEHAHESPRVMRFPLIVLAVGAVIVGWLGSGMVSEEHDFWGGAIAHHAAAAAPAAEHGASVPEGEATAPGEASAVRGEADLEHVPFFIAILPLLAGVLGIGLAYVFYIMRPDIPGRIAGSVQPLYRFLLNKWYFDELYDFLFVRSAKALGIGLWRGGDMGIIDRFGPDGVAASTLATSRQTSRLQTGYVYHYAFAMLIGVAVLVTYYLLGGVG